MAFYTQHRSVPEDLYPSEQRFLPWLATQADSVLDTGCAAGGFSNIWSHYRPDIVYTGVDVSRSLIQAAEQIHPERRFIRADAAHRVPLGDRYATVVQALGWLNWEPEYLAAISELWRLTDRYLFLDVRLTRRKEDSRLGTQRLALISDWDGKTTTPYVTVAWGTFAALLLALKPSRIMGYGYWGNPADTVTGVAGPVCFSTFVLEKPAASASPERSTVCLDLPLVWPDELSTEVDLLPGQRLDSLVPKS